MQSRYTVKDSSFAFLFALFLPNVVAVLFMMLMVGFYGNIKAFEQSILYVILATTVSQICFLFTYFFLTKKRKISFKKSLPFAKVNYKQIIILCLIAFVCLLFISPIINVFDSFLTKLGVSEQSLIIDISKPLNFVYMFAVTGILAPICEEILFRGVVLSGLQKKGVTFSILISSLMFMLIHLSLHQTLYQFVLGVILALVVVITKNILSSILIHFINNAFVLIINYINPLFFDYKFLSLNYIILALVLLVVGALLIFELIKMLKKNSKHVENLTLVCEENGEIQSADVNNVKNNFVPKDFLITSIIVGVIAWIVTVIMSL